MSIKHHYVKTQPKYFLDVKNGIKSFEVRKNDRGYKVGDFLHLQEYYDGKYTGNELVREICYILDCPDYCKKDYVVLGLIGE